MFRSGLPGPSLYQFKSGATQTETPSLKQNDAGEGVHLLDEYYAQQEPSETLIFSAAYKQCAFFFEIFSRPWLIAYEWGQTHFNFPPMQVCCV